MPTTQAPTGQSVPISVVIATVRGYEEMRPALDALRAPVAAAGGEIIVGDGSSAPAPSAKQRGAHLTWIRRPGASVFQLRRNAYRQARGEVVAITEDHCVPHPDWVPRILDAHRRYPDAAVIGGAVENGTPDSLTDWASFFITQGPFLAPFADPASGPIAGQANVSYKRAALAGLVDDELGAMELLHNRRLREAGGSLRADDGILVAHYQALGLRGTSLIHFHNGRAIAGFRRRSMGPEEWAIVAGSSVLPWVRTALVVRGVAARGRLLPQLMASLPLMVWLQFCHAAGAFIGYTLGPGDSARRLR
jgi:Glycosyl transferase family 2